MTPRLLAAARATHEGSFHLALAPDRAFELFTPEGERRWVPGWDPLMLGELGPGTIFLTDHDGEQTIWTILEADRGAGRLFYSRVSPGRRAGTVRVTLAPDGDGTSVTVAYDLTALGPDGEAAVASMAEMGFVAMLRRWEEMIGAALSLEKSE